MLSAILTTKSLIFNKQDKLLLDLFHIILSRIRRSRPHAIHLAVADLHLFELESENNIARAPPGCVSMDFFERFVSSVWGLRPSAVALAGNRFGLSPNQGHIPEADISERSQPKPFFKFALFFGALAFVERWWHTKDTDVDSVPAVALALECKSTSPLGGAASERSQRGKQTGVIRDLVYLPRTRQLVGVNDYGTLLFWPWSIAFKAMCFGNNKDTIKHPQPNQTVVFHATHSIRRALMYSPSSSKAAKPESERNGSHDTDGLDTPIPLRAVRLVVGGEIMSGTESVVRMLVSAAQVQRCHDLDAGDLIDVSGEARYMFKHQWQPSCQLMDFE